jgi:hypothetical protein
MDYLVMLIGMIRSVTRKDEQMVTLQEATMVEGTQLAYSS